MPAKMSMSIKSVVVSAVVCSVLMMSFTSFFKRGEVIDTFNGIPVYYNGEDFTNVSGRHVTRDGYNLGLKYQCVEFVKRYYYQHYGHKMPNTYGHAKEFFDKSLPDVAFNYDRGLMQYRNIRYEAPRVGDLLVYDGHGSNPFGHVGIISEVDDAYIEYVSQNVGDKTRQRIKLVEFQGIYTIADYDVLGWLRPTDP